MRKFRWAYIARTFAFKNSRENRIHGPQLASQIKRVRERFCVEKFADVRVSSHAILEARLRLPSRHGVPLYPFISILSRSAVLDQILQKLPGEN
jgi:hypothetical protein